MEHGNPEQRIQDLQEKVELLIPYARLGEEVLNCWLDDSSIDLFEVQEWAVDGGALIEELGGFDPDKHIDAGYSDASPGDPWFISAKRPTY